ncbi:cyclic nucleotide-binding domain-containing protein [Marivita sp. XM-24bin2]|uniref:cyclic nucleotide-binding domain-containing protein n=1 Tax=unclassified Marivita TaxID=2632480 RepID=UPI0025B8C684|nr:cyclic nucleotide-binding domain-containing protein [Marivita sp. XM-24bin2]MCR9111491.1 cyclic nucleotide-binding domain-containing protein [Paracoccaceae bacterium]
MKRLRTAFCGLLVGATAVVYSISFFAIIFTGDLAIHAETWLGTALIAAGVMALVGGVLFSWRGTVMHPQDVTAALLSVAAAQIAAGLPNGSQDEIVGTILAMIAVTTVTAGIATFAIGRARLSYVVHAIPYPVVLGFLAATGITLVLGAVGLIIERSLTIWDASEAVRADALVRWVPWLSGSVAIFLLSLRFQSPLLLPACVGVTLATFYAVVAVGPGFAAAQANGVMLAAPGAEPGARLAISLYGAADWSAIAAELPVLMTVVGLTIVGGLLNLTGVRYATGQALDLDRDLQAVGAANVASGAAGGLVGYPVVSTTYLGWKVGLKGLGASTAAAGACGAVGLFGTEILTILPKGLFATIIGFLGLDLLLSSLKAAHQRLSNTDRLLFVGVVTVAATFGVLEAISVGFIAAIVLFARAAGQVDVLHARHTLATRTSRTERPDTDMQRLASRGQDVVIFQLKGYLFFGACTRLRKIADDELAVPGRPPDGIILDLSRITGLDVSATLALAEFRSKCAAVGVDLILAGARPEVTTMLQAVGVQESETFNSYATLDDALFAIEETLLCSTTKHGAQSDRTTFLDELSKLHPSFDPLRHFEPTAVAAGARIVHEHDEAQELFVLLSGRAHAILRAECGTSEVVARFLPGTVIGEIALYSGACRSAEVEAVTDCKLLRIDRQSFPGRNGRHEDLSADFHRLVAEALARRLHRYMTYVTEA